jgi:hypothetical protein
MKRNLFCFLLLITTFLFTGCFETTEELTVNENGSGTYHYALDFSGLFDVMDAMKAMDTSSNSNMGFAKGHKDTTIQLRDYTDTASSLTAAQKALYQKGTLHLVINEDQKQFNVTINLPYQKPGDLQKIVGLMGSDENGSLLSKLFKEGNTMGSEGDAMGKGRLPDLNSFYDLLVKKGSIERKLNKTKYDSAMQQYGGQIPLDQMQDMLSSVKLNTIIHLPHALKKVSGANATTSDDKKTVTVKGTLIDLFKAPEVFSYHIEY